MSLLMQRQKTLLFAIFLFSTLNLYFAVAHFDIRQPGLEQALELAGEIAGHHVRDNARDPLKALSDLPLRRTSQSPIVWIGNSQQHAMNQPRPDDELASVALHKLFNGGTWPGNYPVFGMSYPNLGYGEIFALIYALSNLGEKRPDFVVLGLRFQDTKELGYRKEFKDLLYIENQGMGLQRYLARVAARQAIDHLQAELQEAIRMREEPRSIERSLSAITEAILPIYRKREELRSDLLLQLYGIRNYIFGIKTSSKRPLLETRYGTALQYLSMALDVAERSGMRLFIYNIPLRPGRELPYDRDEYARFIRDVTALCEQYRVPFHDYDQLVPESEWGIWDGVGEPDYMHFTGRGHRRLANAVYRDLFPLLDPP